MDLFQAGVVTSCIRSATKKYMHLYVVVEKCHAIFAINSEKAGYIKKTVLSYEFWLA